MSNCSDRERYKIVLCKVDKGLEDFEKLYQTI